jgi:hypothetical protein
MTRSGRCRDDRSAACRSPRPARHPAALPAARVAAAALLAVALTVPLAAAAPRPVGPALLVADSAVEPAIALLDGGGFVVAWRAPAASEGGAAVWVRRFDGRNRPLDAPRRVGDALGSVYGSTPAVAARPGGGFLVAWVGPGPAAAADLPAVHVRRFRADGLPQGPVLRASGTMEAGGPRLAVAPDGGFAVGWTALEEQFRFFADAWARLVDAEGEPRGPAFRVHDRTLNEQSLGDLAFAPDGRLAAAVDTYAGECCFGDVLFSLFDPAGTPLALDVVVNGDPEFSGVSQHGGRLARLADGWLVVFASSGQDGNAHGVFGRLIGDGGEPLGADLPINQVTEREQLAPVPAALPGGGFVVLWTDTCDIAISPAGHCTLPDSYRDGSFAGVYGRAFDAAGQPAGDDFLVPVNTVGPQHAPAVAAGPEGDLVAAWLEELLPHENRDQGIRARRLAAPCEASAATLCLGGGRFAAAVAWSDPLGGSGAGTAEARDDLWGTFWFFDPENLELAVKLIDGTAANGHWWVFSASLSNVAYALRVTDTATGRVALYENPQGTFASRGDTAAFEEIAEAAQAETAASGATAGGLAGAALVPCPPGPEWLCLLGGRFAARIDWQDPSQAGGAGHPLPLTDDTGAFWFFREDNPEIVVKVLDARPVNGRFWVFFASLTNVAFHLEVVDLETGEARHYENPQGTFASRGDTDAFPVAAPPG